MQEKYGVLETAQSRRQNSTKAAETVVAQFSKQIMNVIARQESGHCGPSGYLESFDTDGDGHLSQKELVVGLNEFGIKMSKDERKIFFKCLTRMVIHIEWREFSAVVQRVQKDAEQNKFADSRARRT